MKFLHENLEHFLDQLPENPPGKITRFTFGRFLTLAVFGHILKSKSRSERV